ncbi:hypothetical protein [Maridesulfovibrio frigidus]|uniref:hypothetical protein n=1 Tax=Maridesulfovibrio frigidus TaxID=340956 RepID=UPI000689AC12|nr:hypothetical protein [Maridesulfovibrio frigidus]
MILGLDFDNTIVDYDALFHRAALEIGLVDCSVAANKTAVRDFIRKSDGGEILWQKLQAEVYGPRINEAVLFSGVCDFLSLCIEKKIPAYVVSHKTRFARRGDVDLREAALSFMEKNSLFNSSPYGGSVERVFFADTRHEKGEIIKSLNCDVFVDDLIEVFRESSFPANIYKFLFTPQGIEAPLEADSPPKLEQVKTWSELSEIIFVEPFISTVGLKDGK